MGVFLVRLLCVEGNDLANTGHPTEPINETNHAGITKM